MLCNTVLFTIVRREQINVHMNPKFCLFQNYSGRRIWKQNAVSIMLSLREGYETIYLGNPSEASSEIHLDGAFTSYSRGESGAYLLLLSWCCALKNPEKYASFGIWVDQSDFVCVTRTSFCWVSFAYANTITARQVQRENWFSYNLYLRSTWSWICTSIWNIQKIILRYPNIQMCTSIWNIQKIVLRYPSQMSRRPIKSLFHCHQEIVRKRSSLNFQHFGC